MNSLITHLIPEWEKKTICFLTSVLPDNVTLRQHRQLVNAIVASIAEFWDEDSDPDIIFEKWELLQELNKLKKQKTTEGRTDEGS